MKVVIFLFNEDLMCAQHAFLYARELNEKGTEAEIFFKKRPHRFREDTKVFLHSKSFTRLQSLLDCDKIFRVC